VERFHQILERELLDDVQMWPDVAAAADAADAFRIEYNTSWPHQSLEMAFPADRFTPRPADQRLPLRLPARLSAAVAQLPPEPAPGTTTAAPEAAPDLPAALVVSSNGVDPVDRAVGSTRVVPVSGNMTVCGQQFWLGPDRAGSSIAFWADTTVVHLLANGVRLKTATHSHRDRPRWTNPDRRVRRPYLPHLRRRPAAGRDRPHDHQTHRPIQGPRTRTPASVTRHKDPLFGTDRHIEGGTPVLGRAGGAVRGPGY
jgi:hypothetical protein